MKYRIEPLGNKILLEKIQLDNETENDSPKFFLEEEVGKPEIFLVLDCGKGVSEKILEHDIVVVDSYTPIGNFEGKDLFLTSENFVSAKILKKDKV